jgi:hypothetical protein
MLGHLSARKEKAIAALLTEPTIAAAAKKAGIGEATLYRWLSEDEHFEKAYRAARKSAVEGAIGGLQRASQAAVSTLESNLTCGLPSVEVRAAISVLDYAIKGVQSYDILERLEEIEREMKKN